MLKDLEELKLQFINETSIFAAKWVREGVRREATNTYMYMFNFRSEKNRQISGYSAEQPDRGELRTRSLESIVATKHLGGMKTLTSLNTALREYEQLGNKEVGQNFRKFWISQFVAPSENLASSLRSTDTT